MRRVFVEQPLRPGQLLVVDGQTGHHFARVLRLEAGESLVVSGASGSYDAVAVAVDSKRGTASLEIGELSVERDPTLRVLLVQGMAKADKVDKVIQHTTELGVWGVWVTAMERTVGRLSNERADSKLVRWQRIAQDAASQSQRDRVPRVAYFADRGALEDALFAQMPRKVFMLDERETVCGIRQALRRESLGQLPSQDSLTGSESGGSPIVLVVGPEGGFSDAERSWWVDKIGAQTVTLGRRILRTETAGLVALAAVFCEAGDLGG